MESKLNVRKTKAYYCQRNSWNIIDWLMSWDTTFPFSSFSLFEDVKRMSPRVPRLEISTKLQKSWEAVQNINKKHNGTDILVAIQFRKHQKLKVRHYNEGWKSKYTNKKQLEEHFATNYVNWEEVGYIESTLEKQSLSELKMGRGSAVCKNPY